jgi:hypothetical protein
MQTERHQEQADQLLAEYCRLTGMTWRETWTTGELVELLARLGFVADEGTLEMFVQRGRMEAPEGLWDSVAVQRAVTELDVRRRWRAGSEFHDKKKSAARIEVEQVIRESRGPELFADVDQYDLEALLLNMVESENRQVREQFYERVRIKLHVLGVNCDA